MNMRSDIEKLLRHAKPRGLSPEEKSSLWSNIKNGIASAHGSNAYRLYNLSIFRYAYFQKRKVAFGFMVALLTLGSGITVVAANGAKPGDILFPIDLAAEKVQIALSTSATGRDNLRVQFARERLSEVQSIIEEHESLPALVPSNVNTTTGTTTAVNASTTTTKVDTPAEQKMREQEDRALASARAYLEDARTQVEIDGNVSSVETIDRLIDELSTISTERDHREKEISERSEPSEHTETGNKNENKGKNEKKIEKNIDPETQNDEETHHSNKTTDTKTHEADTHENDREDGPGVPDISENKPKEEHKEIVKRDNDTNEHQEISGEDSDKNEHEDEDNEDEGDDIEHGNGGTSVPVDTTPPLISAIGTVTGTTTATITWTTNEPADSTVWYGTSTPLSIGGTTASGGSGTATYTISEVATHNTAADCWLVMHGKVYNVTTFISSHPGGVQQITSRCGTDAGTAFDAIGHSGTAQNMLTPLYIGDIGASSNTGTQTSTSLSVSNPTLTMNHTAILQPLTANTTYYYTIISKDSSGNTATSPESSFQTPSQ